MDVNTIINLLFLILLFAIVAYSGFWVCDRAKMPLPVFWVFGLFLLVILLLLVTGQVAIPKALQLYRFPGGGHYD